MEATASMVRCARPDKRVAITTQFASALRVVKGTFAEREAAALALANELVREWTERELGEVEASFGREVAVGGQRYRRHEAAEGTYHSLCGPITVRRCTYRKVGVHNGPTIVPLELATGMVEGATPALAYSAAHGFATATSREYEADLRAAHRHPPSRSTLDRFSRAIATGMQRALPTIEPVVREAESIPSTVVTLSMGVDRTTAPMAEPRGDLDDEPRRRRRTPYVRRPPPPIEVVYRMPYVGTIALHDGHGDVVAVRRFAATPTEGPKGMLERMFAEIAHARAQRPGLAIVVVQDGAPELWKLVDDGCRRHDVQPKARLIDWFHVDERLAAALEIVAVDARTARQLHDRWRTMLLRSDTAIDRISRLLELLDCVLGWAAGEEPLPKRLRGIIRPHLDTAAQAVFAQHVAYITRHKHKMRYASARARGFPIGSGITEGACKSVVTMRCKRSGQRWCTAGLSACLALRTLLLSDRLRPCFALLQASYTREVRPA